MKLTATTGTYTPIIAGSSADTEAESGDTDYSIWAEVPDDYIRVAYRTSGTDIGILTNSSPEGSTITSTYKVYIDNNQPSGTYSGKVKFTLVHPADGTAPVIPSETSCTTPVPNLTYMQDLNSSNKASILAGMTEDAQYFLKDKRDEKSYCVAKLKDGNIWMTQNLDLDITTQGAYNATTSTYTAFTNQNTDIGWNSTTSSYDPASWIPVANTHASNDTEWNDYDATSNPDGGDSTHAESYDPGNLYVNPDMISYYIGDISEEPASETVSDVADSNSHDHLGNYYNWTAAVAINNSSSYTAGNTDINQSICPSGWTLAKAGNNTSNGSFRYLFDQYGTWNSATHTLDNDYNPMNSPIYLSLAGSWYGTLNEVALSGFYYSSTIGGSTSAYNLETFVGGDFTPGNAAGGRYVGHSVRCVSR